MPYNVVSFASEALFRGYLKGKGTLVSNINKSRVRFEVYMFLHCCVCLTLPLYVLSSGFVALLGWESGFLCYCLLASVVERSRVCVVCVDGSCSICECFRVGIAYVSPGSDRGCDSVAVFYVLWGTWVFAVLQRHWIWVRTLICWCRIFLLRIFLCIFVCAICARFQLFGFFHL
jgi:hypothetical protein